MKKIRTKSFIVAISMATLISCNKDDEKGITPPAVTATLTEVASTNQQWTGVAVSQENRIFANYAKLTTDTVSASVIEITSNGSTAPFPDVAWNTWDPSLPPQDHFVSVQSVYIDKENFLWVLDPANPQMRGTVRGGPKLLKFNLATNQLVQKILFDETIAFPASYLNDVRVDTEKDYAYITDSGKGAIIVVNLTTGQSMRLLGNHFSTKSENLILTVEGRVWKNKDESIPTIHSDGIALHPQGTYIYYQALTGENLYRIGTNWLQDATLTEAQLEEKVERVGQTGPADGIVFGQDGSLYLTALEQNAINRITPNGGFERVIQDVQLKWPDSFAVGPDGSLYVTTSQLHIPAAERKEPFKIFKVNIDSNQ